MFIDTTLRYEDCILPKDVIFLNHRRLSKEEHETHNRVAGD